MKTPEAIVDFYNNKSYEEQIAIVPEIEKSNHLGSSFYEVCGMAYHYAKYVTGSTKKHIIKTKHIVIVPQ